MKSNPNGISTLVLDFDGTCTQIPGIYRNYWEEYRNNLSVELGEVTATEWDETLNAVRTQSPIAGWTLGGAQSAPAAADPYILAYEAAQFLYRKRKLAKPDLPSPNLSAVHTHAYEKAPAPWRESAKEVFEQLLERGVTVSFISNSATSAIKQRLVELFGSASAAERIQVHGGAAKFLVQEPMWETRPTPMLEIFRSFPAEAKTTYTQLQRPIYLRRGSYFQAISKIVQDDREQLSRTLFCGDIWELDLALPAAFGARIHLLERAAPFSTYSYERSALADVGSRGRSSEDLDGLLPWFK